MSSTKDYMFAVEELKAEMWIRERLSDDQLNENSEEWQELAEEYSIMMEAKYDEAMWEAELKWLKDSGSSEIHQHFIHQVESLLELTKNTAKRESGLLRSSQRELNLKMSYAYSVTLLEAYLSDTLKSIIDENPAFLSNAISEVEQLKISIPLKEANQEGFSVKKKVLQMIDEHFLFHKMSFVKAVFSKVLGVSLSVDISQVSKITSIRHDIVHRNGVSTNGKKLQLDVNDFEACIEEILCFASDLQQKINETT